MNILAKQKLSAAEKVTVEDIEDACFLSKTEKEKFALTWFVFKCGFTIPNDLRDQLERNLKLEVDSETLSHNLSLMRATTENGKDTRNLLVYTQNIVVDWLKLIESNEDYRPCSIFLLEFIKDLVNHNRFNENVIAEVVKNLIKLCSNIQLPDKIIESSYEVLCTLIQLNMLPQELMQEAILLALTFININKKSYITLSSKVLLNLYHSKYKLSVIQHIRKILINSDQYEDIICAGAISSLSLLKFASNGDFPLSLILSDVMSSIKSRRICTLQKCVELLDKLSYENGESLSSLDLELCTDILIFIYEARDFKTYLTSSILSKIIPKIYTVLFSRSKLSTLYMSSLAEFSKSCTEEFALKFIDHSFSLLLYHHSTNDAVEVDSLKLVSALIGHFFGADGNSLETRKRILQSSAKVFCLTSGNLREKFFLLIKTNFMFGLVDESDTNVVVSIFQLMLDVQPECNESDIESFIRYLESFILIKATSKSVEHCSVVLKAIDTLHVILSVSAESLGNFGFKKCFTALVNLASAHPIEPFARKQILKILLSFRANANFQVDFETRYSLIAEEQSTNCGFSNKFLTVLSPNTENFELFGISKNDLQQFLLPKNQLFVPIDMYLDAILKIISTDTSWDVFWYVLKHLPIQLENVYIFLGSIFKLHEFTTLCYGIIDKESVASSILDFTNQMKKTELYESVYKLSISLLLYRHFFSKKQQDELAYSFQVGLQKWPRSETAKVCIQALTLALFELPDSLIKLLSSILLKVSQTTSSNIVEEDYKRVFGVAISYIQYTDVSGFHKGKGSETRNMGQTAVNQYIVSIAYSVLSSWFKNIKFTERKKYIPFILQLLRQNKSSSQISTDDESSEIVVDVLAQNSYSESFLKVGETFSGPLDVEPENSCYRWFIENSIVFLEKIPYVGDDWFRVQIRRPSGLIEFKTQLTISTENDDINNTTDDTKNVSVTRRTRSSSFGSNAESTHNKEEIGTLSMGRRKTISTNSLLLHSKSSFNLSSHMINDKELKIFKKFLQIVPFPDWSPQSIPLNIPNEDSINRGIRVLDHIPIVNLHKVGVVYVGPNQTEENEILSNTCGSEAYRNFLTSLGEFVTLKGCKDVYTGGLDISDDIDGEHALCLRATAVTSHFMLFGRLNLLTFYYINRPDVPETIGGGVSSGANVNIEDRPKLLSASSIGQFMRTFSIHADIFAQVYHASQKNEEYTSNIKERLRQIKRIKKKVLNE
ncbi:Tuberous sclerosis 2-like protein [Clydaea vesicula]|uniref:Tuberous sclerosis 2-like protein n=1 Tax=Clydaea vesicula TaxID=447962 RepID=A0AAD5Y279_9FUNG|nr:Tuberous sclerosis 2-like protein [Clydaea vesicula]